MITAIVNGNGTYYKDIHRTERLYLHVHKSEAQGLPSREGARVPITLVVGGVEYAGALCSRSNYPYLFVATNLLDPNGVVRKLTYILRDQGLSKGQRVQLRVCGARVEVV